MMEVILKITNIPRMKEFLFSNFCW